MKQTQLFKDEEILLGDLCEIVIGKTPSRKDLDNFGEDYIWVSIGDMNEKYIEDSKEKLTAKGIKESNARLIPTGTLLLSFKLSLGKVAITKKPLYTNEAIAALIPKRRINVEYLYYYLKQTNLSAYARKAVKGLCINKRILSRVKIRLVPTETQDKIVSILEKAEQLKRWRKEADKLTDDYLNSVFLEMFGDPIKNEKNWTVKALEETSEKITDGKHGDCNNLDDSGYYFISAKDLVDGKIEYLNARQITRDDFLEVHRRTDLDIGDVLISNSGTIGKIAIVTDKEKAKRTTFQKSVAIIKNRKQFLNSYFLQYFLELSKEYLINKSSGSSQKNLLLRDIKKFEIILPPIELQEKFAEIVENIEQLKEMQKQSGKQIDNLFNDLMNKAFRGKLIC